MNDDEKSCLSYRMVHAVCMCVSGNGRVDIDFDEAQEKVEALLAEAAGRKSAMPTREDFEEWAKGCGPDGYFGALDAYEYLVSRIEGEK